jgi:hypothetical protein
MRGCARTWDEQSVWVQVSFLTFNNRSNPPSILDVLRPTYDRTKSSIQMTGSGVITHI